MTEVFNAHLDRVLIFLLKEGLSCHVTNRSLDFVASLERLLEISLDISYCLSLQLESEILLLQFFILLVGRSQLILHLLDILFGCLKGLLVAIEVTLQALHVSLNLSHLPIHVNDFLADLIGCGLAHCGAMGGDFSFELFFQVDFSALVTSNLGTQVPRNVLVALCNFVVRAIKLTCHVSILIVLGEATLGQWTCLQLLSQATHDNI